MTRIRPVRRGSEDVVDELEQVWEVSNGRLLAGRVGHVLFVCRDLASALAQGCSKLSSRGLTTENGLSTCLLEHHLEQHIQPGVLLYHLLKLYQSRVELFRVGIDMLNCVVQKLVVVSLVLREPVSGLDVSRINGRVVTYAVNVVLVGNG